MNPVAIFQHAPTEGPAYFATFLERNGIAYRVVRIDQGEPVPADAAAYSGLVLMGGPMSVNDDLPWIPRALELIGQAVARDVPVLGHCLGGQLMAKALGGVVTRNPVKEIGWGRARVLDNPQAAYWLGEPREVEVFQWHGETFSIPPDALRLLESAYCENQMFALGKHLAMQCHVEMTPDLIASWCETGKREIASSPGPAVQSPEVILAGVPEKIGPMQRLADSIYTRWIRGLQPNEPRQSRGLAG